MSKFCTAARDLPEKSPSLPVFVSVNRVPRLLFTNRKPQHLHTSLPPPKKIPDEKNESPTVVQQESSQIMPVRRDHFVKGDLPAWPSSFHIGLQSAAPVPCLTAQSFVSWTNMRFTGLIEVIRPDRGSLWVKIVLAKTLDRLMEFLQLTPTIWRSFLISFPCNTI